MRPFVEPSCERFRRRARIGILRFPYFPERKQLHRKQKRKVTLALARSFWCSKEPRNPAKNPLRFIRPLALGDTHKKREGLRLARQRIFTLGAPASGDCFADSIGHRFTPARDACAAA